VHRVINDEELRNTLPPANASGQDVLTFFKEASPNATLKLQRKIARHVAKEEYAAMRSSHLQRDEQEAAARVTSTAGLSASAFLLAEPTSQRTTITDAEFSLASKLRLGVTLDQQIQQRCSCSAAARVMASHVFACKHRGRGHINWRHNMVRDALYQVIMDVGASARREPCGLADDRSRPDLEVFIDGQCYLVDVTIRVPTALTYVRAAAVPRQVLRQAERAKHARYDGMAQEAKAQMVPFVMDIFGGFGEEATKFLALLATHAEAMNKDRSMCYRDAVSSIACALLRGNERVYRHHVTAWRL
jgi:hypothetical protein